MTALVVFDIEAVPDFEMARCLLAQPDDTPDAEIRRMSKSENLARNSQIRGPNPREPGISHNKMCPDSHA